MARQRTAGTPPQAQETLLAPSTAVLSPGAVSGALAAPTGAQTLILDNFPSPALARDLSPNGRAHWREKRRAGATVYAAVMAALAERPMQPMTGRVVLSPVFVFPVHRRRDDDNLATGVMKVVRDSLVARGILADDSTLHVRQEPVRVIVEKGQRRLEIELRPSDGRREGEG